MTNVKSLAVENENFGWHRQESQNPEIRPSDVWKLNTKYTTSLLKLSLMTVIHLNMTNFWLFECLYYLEGIIKKMLKINLLVLHMQYFTFIVPFPCIWSPQHQSSSQHMWLCIIYKIYLVVDTFNVVGGHELHDPLPHWVFLAPFSNISWLILKY